MRKSGDGPVFDRKVVDEVKEFFNTKEEGIIFAVDEPTDPSKKEKQKINRWVGTEWALYKFIKGKKSHTMERWYAWQFVKTVSLTKDEISFCFLFPKKKKGVYEMRNQILRIRMKEASIKVYDAVLAYMRKIIPTKSDQFPNFMNMGNYEVHPDNIEYDTAVRFRQSVRFYNCSEKERFYEKDPVKMKKAKDVRDLYPENKEKLYAANLVAGRQSRCRMDAIPKHTQALLETLSVIPTINTLVIPPINSTEQLGYLTAFLDTNVSITKLEFTETLSVLRELIPKFQKMENNLIKRIGLDRIELKGRRDMDDITKLIQCGITHLNMTSMIKKEKHFMWFIKAASAFSGITHLCIDNCSEINLRTLLNELPDLKVLSMASCNIEVATIMETICELAVPLREITISGNPCVTPMAAKIVLPPSLHVIQADNITWGISNLRNLWRCLMNHKPYYPLRLSFSNAGMPSKKQWDQVFHVMEVTSSDFIELLQWNNNPVCEAFFESLTKCRRLKTLYLSGCVHESSVFGNNIDALTNFLKNTVSLREIMINATEKVVMTEMNMRDVVKALIANKSLKKVSMCDHGVGEDLMVVLHEALKKNRRIEYFDTRGNNIIHSAIYELTWSLLGERGTPLWMPYPDDVIKNDEELTAAKRQKLRGMYENMVKGNDNERPEGTYEFAEIPELEPFPEVPAVSPQPKRAPVRKISAVDIAAEGMSRIRSLWMRQGTAHREKPQTAEPIRAERFVFDTDDRTATPTAESTHEEEESSYSQYSSHEESYGYDRDESTTEEEVVARDVPIEPAPEPATAPIPLRESLPQIPQSMMRIPTLSTINGSAFAIDNDVSFEERDDLDPDAYQEYALRIDEMEAIEVSNQEIVIGMYQNAFSIANLIARLGR